MASAVPIATSDITYFPTETTHFAQTDGVGFASRAAPFAVHGGEFADNFKSGLSSSVLTFATADLHTLVGDHYSDANDKPINGGEGSIGHVLTHATVGCVSGELQGGSCDAGAAAGGVAAILSGQIKGSGADYADAQEWTDEVRLAAGLGAALTGADNTDVQIAAGVGQSTFENNYLTHTDVGR